MTCNILHTLHTYQSLHTLQSLQSYGVTLQTLNSAIHPKLCRVGKARHAYLPLHSLNALDWLSQTPREPMLKEVMRIMDDLGCKMGPKNSSKSGEMVVITVLIIIVIKSISQFWPCRMASDVLDHHLCPDFSG